MDVRTQSDTVGIAVDTIVLPESPTGTIGADRRFCMHASTSSDVKACSVRRDEIHGQHSRDRGGYGISLAGNHRSGSAGPIKDQGSAHVCRWGSTVQIKPISGRPSCPPRVWPELPVVSYVSSGFIRTYARTYVHLHPPYSDTTDV